MNKITRKSIFMSGFEPKVSYYFTRSDLREFEEIIDFYEKENQQLKEKLETVSEGFKTAMHDVSETTHELNQKNEVIDEAIKKCELEISASSIQYERNHKQQDLCYKVAHERILNILNKCKGDKMNKGKTRLGRFDKQGYKNSFSKGELARELVYTNEEKDNLKQALNEVRKEIQQSKGMSFQKEEKILQIINETLGTISNDSKRDGEELEWLDENK